TIMCISCSHVSTEVSQGHVTECAAVLTHR
ncbi:MAG: hypothetical protein ACI91F_002108, partial [Candidatus Binatia bacterium]